MATLTLIAAYDIRDDDRRARLAATLQTIGDRVQKSVFVIVVDDKELLDLQQRASNIIDPKTDSLIFFRQCSPCWDSYTVVGQGRIPDAVTHWCVW